MTINVLHLRDTSEIGGPGKTILETAAHIDTRKFRMHIGVFKTRNEPDDTPFLSAARDRGCSVHVIRSFNQFSPSIILTLSKFVKDLDIHLLHSHEVKSDVLAFLIKKMHGLPLVTTLHGWIQNGFRGRFYTYIDKRIVRSFDKIIVVSETMRQELARHSVDLRRISILHNAVVFENYRAGGPKGYFQELTGRELQRPFIGVVGRLSPEKGQRDFVEAATIIRDRGYDATFLIVGDGPERSLLEGLIAEKNLESRAVLTGYVRDIKRVFHDIDLMVLPSHTEGMPNAVLEAMAAGVPVIATNVGGVSEIIQNHTNGIMVPPRSPREMADAVIAYLENPDRFRAMAAQAEVTVRTHFNFAERTKKLESIYADLFGPGVQT